MKAKTKAVIDIETGGFSKNKNALCEVGIVIIDENFRIIDELNILISPYGAEYNHHAMLIHGITIETLEKEGIPPGFACKKIRDFLEKYQTYTFIGHNIKRFDLPFLRAFFDRFSKISDLVSFEAYEDTLIIAKTRLNLSSYALGALCNFYHVKNEDAHSAIGDCKATLEVYRNLIS